MSPPDGRSPRDTPPRTVEVPEDLAAALAAHPSAAAAWERLGHTRQRQVTEALVAARKADTRSRRLDAAIAELTP